MQSLKTTTKYWRDSNLISFQNFEVRSISKCPSQRCFFFFAWRELHNNKLNYYCKFPFWIKKNFQNNCITELCSNSGHLTVLLPHNKKILVFFIEIIPRVACESIQFFRLKFLVSPPRKTRNLESKKTDALAGYMFSWALDSSILLRSQPCTVSAAYPALPRRETALHLTSSLLLLGLRPTFFASQKICCKGHQLRLH